MTSSFKLKLSHNGHSRNSKTTAYRDGELENFHENIKAAIRRNHSVMEKELKEAEGYWIFLTSKHVMISLFNEKTTILNMDKPKQIRKKLDYVNSNKKR